MLVPLRNLMNILKKTESKRKSSREVQIKKIIEQDERNALLTIQGDISVKIRAIGVAEEAVTFRSEELHNLF